ncbi:MAG: hypothetical protein MJZ24_07370 [Paludibacteraceae bacterium]|nr:hypothetical protein [Candidatus Physcocola equi]MCQ2234539.1 hypothetical protein [Paludibacteraceae bacterium]
MKKLFVIGVAALAMIFASCKSKTQETPVVEEPTATEAPAPEATEAPAETAVVAPTAMEQLGEIAKLVEAAANAEDLKAAAEKYNEFKTNIKAVADALSEADKAQLTELFKTVGENIVKKELEFSKK